VRSSGSLCLGGLRATQVAARECGSATEDDECEGKACGRAAGSYAMTPLRALPLGPRSGSALRGGAHRRTSSPGRRGRPACPRRSCAPGPRGPHRGRTARASHALHARAASGRRRQASPWLTPRKPAPLPLRPRPGSPATPPGARGPRGPARCRRYLPPASVPTGDGARRRAGPQLCRCPCRASAPLPVGRATRMDAANRGVESARKPRRHA
jgi:hypothetical protein